MRDWILALQWVRENIAAFGGDPAKVTIAGQSAGGGACAALLGAPAARGLFRGAICMSGSTALAQTPDGVRAVAAKLAGQLNVPLSKNAFDGLTAAQIVAAQQAIMPDMTGEMPHDPAIVAAALAGLPLPWAPWVDGEVITENPWQAVRRGDVPVLAGATENEFNMVWLAQDWTTADMVTEALTKAGVPAAQAAAYLDKYQDKRPCDIVGQALTDRTFRVPAAELAAAVTAAGGPAAGYSYDFRWPAADGPLRGLAFHCLDVPFAFGNLGEPAVAEVAGPNPPESLAADMHGAFVRFVADGTPGWPGSGSATMLFGVPSAVADDPMAMERAAWAAAVRPQAQRGLAGT